MSVRSLPHFSHRPIGKTTHKKGMSYHHVNYITREDACSKTLSGNMPCDRDDARPYFESEAYKDGIAANARIADTLIIALPLELSKEQRHEAIAGFMEKIGHGRIAWLASFHDLGKDEANPHCHVIFRDADIETGRKVVGTTTSSKDVKEAEAKGWRVPPRMTTKDLRVAWCEHLNKEMERHGLEARVDQRTLREQGVDRDPGIHVGPKANSMAKNGRDFESSDRVRADHANIYTLLDAGSRAEHNQRIAEENRRRDEDRLKGIVAEKPKPRGQEGREKRELRERQSAERKVMYQDQARDRAALREAQDAQKLEHQRWGRALYAEARERAFQQTKEQSAAKWKEVRDIKVAAEREHAAIALKTKQKEVYVKSAAREIEQAKPVKNEAWQNLKDAQETERKQLQQRHLQETATLSRQHIAERHALHERWQNHAADKQTQQISAKLEARQGMAAVQATAVTMIKLRAKAAQDRDGKAIAAAPTLAAAMHFSERARAEGANRRTIRYELNATRQSNQIRAAATGERRHAPGQVANGRNDNRVTMHAQIVARQQANQNAVRQNAASGQPLTDAERANSSPDVKAVIAAKEKSTRNHHDASFKAYLESKRSERGRDGGGRSGR